MRTKGRKGPPPATPSCAGFEESGTTSKGLKDGNMVVLAGARQLWRLQLMMMAAAQYVALKAVVAQQEEEEMMVWWK